MTEYLCNGCSYTTTSKTRIIAHVNKKKDRCSDKEDIINIYGELYREKNEKNENEKNEKVKEKTELRKPKDPERHKDPERPTERPTERPLERTRIIKNNYDNPSIDHISDSHVLNLIKNFNDVHDLERIYVNLFKSVYFDKDIKENHCVSNVNSTKLNIFYNNKILMVSKAEFRPFLEKFENNVINKLLDRLEYKSKISDDDKLEFLKKFDDFEIEYPVETYGNIINKIYNLE
jgi:hypothetical protein